MIKFKNIAAPSTVSIYHSDIVDGRQFAIFKNHVLRSNWKICEIFQPWLSNNLHEPSHYHEFATLDAAMNWVRAELDDEHLDPDACPRYGSNELGFAGEDFDDGRLVIQYKCLNCGKVVRR